MHRWQGRRFFGRRVGYSQALSEVSETTTQVTTKEIGKAIVERREEERRRRPVHEPARPVREPARAVPPEKPKPAAVERKEPPPPPALLPLPIEPAVRFGTWTQVFGDYQKRDAAGPTSLNGVQPTLALNIESRTSTVGFVALISPPGAFFLRTMGSSEGDGGLSRHAA